MDTNQVYTYQDLQNWPVTKEVHLAVIGDPIDHSLSPVLHNAALAQMGSEFAHWRYFKFHIDKHHLPEALVLFYQKRFMGLNLTVPHKVEALKYLVSIDEVAKVIGAVNTLLYSHKGYRGLNTDGEGLQAAIKQELNVELKGAEIVLLGAGGAAKAAAAQCLLADCKKLWIGNRSTENLNDLLGHLSIMAKDKVEGFNYDELPLNLPDNCIIINGTTIYDSLLIDISLFGPKTKVFDMLYWPKESTLLREARELGMSGANGLRMLVEQGARSLEAWSKKKVPVRIMWQSALDALERIN